MGMLDSIRNWIWPSSQWSPGTAPNPFAVPSDPAASDPYHDGQWSPLIAPVLTHPDADQVRADPYVPPYTGPLDLDDYGRETDEMRRAYRDLHRTEPALRSAIDGKAAAVAALDVSVLPEDKDHPDDCRAAQFVDWTVSRSPHGWDGLILAILRPALIDGFSLAEKVLKGVDDSRQWHGFWGLKHVKARDTAHLQLRLDGYRNVLGVVNTVRGLRTYSPAKFIRFTHAELFDNPFGQSDLRAAYRAAGQIQDAYRLWYLALKRCGEPYLHGKYDHPAHRAEFEKALRALRAGGWAVTGPKDEIAVLDLAGAASFDAFERKVRLLREDIFLAVRGAYTPFMQANSGAGETRGNTAISQHGGSDPVEEALARAVGRVLTDQLVPDLVRPNFGDRVGLPRVVLGGVNWGELRTRLDILERARKLGLSVSARWANETLQIPPAATPDDELGGPPQGGSEPGEAAPPAPRTFAHWDRSHLVLKEIIDKNGKRTHVWVNPRADTPNQPDPVTAAELESRITQPSLGSLGERLYEGQADAILEVLKTWWDGVSPERRKALADWYANASDDDRRAAFAKLDRIWSGTQRDAFLNTHLGIPLPPQLPPPPMIGDAPPPRPRTGTIEDLRAWQQEAADYLAGSAAAGEKRRAELEAEVPKDAGNRGRWIQHWTDRTRRPEDMRGGGARTQGERLQAAGWAEELLDYKNFVLGSDGRPIPITEEGKRKRAELNQLLAEYAKYRGMSEVDKLAEALKYAVDHDLITGDLKERVVELLKPANLAVFGGFVAVGAGAAYAGGPATLALGALVYFLMGKTAIEAGHDLFLGVGIAMGAQRPEDIQEAAKKLAHGIGGLAETGATTAAGAGVAKLGVMGAGFLGKSKGKKVKQGETGQLEIVPDGPPAPAEGAPGAAKPGAPEGPKAGPGAESPPAAGGAGGDKPPSKPTATGSPDPPNGDGGVPGTGPTPPPKREPGELPASGPASPIVPQGGTGATNESLLAELAKSGVKHSPDQVIAIAKDPGGKIIFLEQGNSKAGLQHIVDGHGADFARRGIPTDQIADAVIAAVTKGKQVGIQGTRPVYEVEFNGKMQRIAVTVSKNGFIVGANPAGK